MKGISDLFTTSTRWDSTRWDSTGWDGAVGHSSTIITANLLALKAMVLSGPYPDQNRRWVGGLRIFSALNSIDGQRRVVVLM